MVRQKLGSNGIIRVRGWDFLVPLQYIRIDTFSRPLCAFFKVLYDFCQFRMEKIDFLCLFQSEK